MIRSSQNNKAEPGDKMKTRIKTSRLGLFALVAISASSIATTAHARNPKEVSLEIVDDTLVIISKENENDCPWYEQRGNGCIKVKKGEKSEIFFHLKGNTKCNQPYGTEWKLNAVYLGGYNSSTKPGDFGFDATDPAVFDQINADFNIADKSSGRVTTTENSAKKIAINNENQSKYLVWYKLEATCERTDGGQAHVTTTDPRIKNGGTE